MGIVRQDPTEGGVDTESSAPQGSVGSRPPATTQLTEKSFDQLRLASPGLLVVDFRAMESSSSHVVAASLKELADASRGHVTLATVDVRQTPGLAARYSIRSIPTILFLKNGKVVDRVIGEAPNRPECR